ncbi:MAG: DUF4351 domain-containing protein [Synechococcales cyanobacterium RM1_1_8]|nr:DUF4351 domain-containing protein [Synechococcales cyanobacterium RM1_1_8]
MVFPLQDKYVNLLTDFENFSPDEQDSYQSSLKYYRDLNNVIDSSWQEGVEQGREQGQRSMIALIGELTRRVGALPSEVLELIDGLSLVDLEVLGEALMGFSELDVLVQCLRGW